MKYIRVFHPARAAVAVQIRSGRIGAYLAIIQCIALIWGNETQILRSGIDQTWTMFDVRLAQVQVMGPILALAATGILFIWLNGAERGLELRALSDNPILIALHGRNVRNLRRWVFGLSAAPAATVTIAQAWDVGFDPHGGLKKGCRWTKNCFRHLYRWNGCYRKYPMKL